MQLTDALELAIHQELDRVVTCTLEELSESLPSYSWSEVFFKVDRLSRAGAITRQRSDTSGYLLSLTPRRFAEARHLTPV